MGINRRKGLWKTGIFLLLVFSFLSMGTVAGAQVETVKIGFSAITGALLPVYVAQRRGFFEREGVKTQAFEFKGGSETMQAIISGDVHIYAGGPDTSISAYDEGINMKVFVGVLNTMVYEVYTHPSIKTINDAKGKRFAISKYGGQADFVTRKLFRYYNFDPEKDIKILQVGSNPARLAALKSGAVDGAILEQPLIDLARKAGFFRLILASDIIKDWCFDVMAARADFIEKNRETVKKLVAGYKKAVASVKNDKEGTIKVIMEVFSVSREDAEASYDYYAPLFPSDASINVNGLQAIIDIGKQAGDLKGNFPAKDVVDTSFVTP